MQQDDKLFESTRLAFSCLMENLERAKRRLCAVHAEIRASQQTRRQFAQIQLTHVS